MSIQKTYTVITGASLGLGYAFAIECAKMGRNLLLIALPNEKMREKAQAIASQHKVEAIPYEVNFTHEGAVERCTQWIIEHYEIDMLINNAGVGGTQGFGTSTKAYIDQIILLNVRVLVHITHQLLPVLQKQKAAFILNIASLAAIGPFPYKTVYPASKAFVYSFSRGLQAELKDSKVHIGVALPGGMATHPEVAQRMQKHGYLMRSSYLSPEETARICLRKLLRKKTRIIPGFLNQMLAIFLQFVPVNIRLNILRRNLARELNLGQEKTVQQDHL